MAGAILTTLSAVLILAVVAAGLAGWEGGPYIGIVAFLILPGFFILGLLLIPAGAALQRRRERAAEASGVATPRLPIFDLNKPRTRRWLIGIAGLSAVNVVILAVAGYHGLEVMDSPQFCGSCHSVMAPEFTAYERSPHSRVTCVQCHIGPGANWFVKSKLSGLWQVVSVSLDLYPRPIPTPIHNLRPARDTCEQCHWPAKFVGDRLKVKTHYSDDEAATETKTVVLLHVGGGASPETPGIHWHVNPGVRIRYLADEKREKIGRVEATLPGGEVRTYDSKVNGEPGTVWREMDCVDCHNRPTHIFRAPDVEVDDSITAGRIARDLPFIRREAVKALKAEFPSHEAARDGLVQTLKTFYAEEYPAVAAERGKDIETAGAELGAIYTRNVWPSMRIEWGTYPSHLGHEATEGCFRCHNDEHSTSDGKTLSQDCSLCHTILADREKSPAILKQLLPDT
jgi:nitrate/TMAO reductase-like tetraheme cytochrome c subunit